MTTGISDGVYFLRSKGHDFQTVLDLTGGEWKNGQLQVVQPDSREDYNTWRNQRYLITQVPGNEKWYHISNLFYGVQAGIYPTASEWSIKCAPTTPTNQKAHWSFDFDGWGLTAIAYRPDTERCFNVNENHFNGDVIAFKSGPNKPDNEKWMPVRDNNFDIAPLRNWMSHVAGNPKLSMLNLVGTHQSTALHAVKSQGYEGAETSATDVVAFGHSGFVDNPRCQNRSPLQQLLGGVRYLDCRFAPYIDNDGKVCLWAYHGSETTGAIEGYSFLAVLQTLKYFLSTNPTETVIVKVDFEYRHPRWVEAIRSDLTGFGDIFHRGSGSIHQVNLDDVRGKAILLFDYDGETVPEAFNKESDFLKGNGAKFCQAGRYNISMNEFDGMKVDITNNINAAKQDWDVSHVYKNDWNASMALVYNPINAYNKFHDTMVRVYSDIGVGGQHRIGIQMFDFYELIPVEVLAIVRSNPGCDVCRN